MTGDIGERPARRPRYPSRKGHLLAGLICLATLEGCSGAPSATPSPTSAQAASTATSSSVLVTPSNTTTTTDAQAALQAEAVEAVKKFYDAWNAAIVSRDSRAMRALVLPQCVLCMSDIGNIDDLKKQNQTVRGGQVTLGKLTASKGSDQAIAVQGEVVRAPVEIFGADGALVRSFAVDRVPNMLWILERSGGVLKIRDQVR